MRCKPEPGAGIRIALAPALRSLRVIGTARAILSCFTFLFTHSSGFSSGEYGGRKNSSSLPPVPATYSLTFRAL